MQLGFIWLRNVTFALLRPRPALELCGGGFMTTESLLWVAGGCGWWAMPLATGEVFEGESKKGFLVERTGPESFPSIMVVVLPWVILPPSGHCPLLRARIMVLLVNPFICWPKCSEFPLKLPFMIILLVLPAVVLSWPVVRNICELSGDLERGSSLKGSLSGVGK